MKKIGKKEILDSTFVSLAKGNDRLKALRASYRGKKCVVWMAKATDTDPINYTRPRNGPY